MRKNITWKKSHIIYDNFTEEQIKLYYKIIEKYSMFDGHEAHLSAVQDIVEIYNIDI